MFFKIAYRNILRHKRRSLFTMVTIVSGVVGVILFGGFVEANYTGLRESVIRSQYGHTQIYKQGYIENHRKAPNEVRMTPEQVEQMTDALSERDDVLVTSRRLEFTGLLGNDSGSQAAIVRAVDPDTESLINSALTIIDGNDLDEEEIEGALLGEGLAEALNAQVGDYLTLLSSDSEGAMNAVDVRVDGVFRSFAKEFDDRAMMMNMEQAQSLLSTEDVDKIVVLLNDTALLKSFTNWLRLEIAESDGQFEFQEWFQLATFYHKVVDLYDGFFLFINIVIIGIVLLAIANTMMITVMERTQEIGTLRSLGARKFTVSVQFITEGMLLAAISAFVGILVAVFLSYYITSLEIMMPPPPGSSQGFPLRIEYVPILWLKLFVGVVMLSSIATWYPSNSAVNKNIVEALRYV